MILMIPHLSYAKPSCDEVLQKCDEALHAQIDLNVTQKSIIDDQATLITTLNTKIDEQSIWKPIALGGIVVIGVETLILILRK